MPEVIPCPACGHQVRVPDSLFGQAVRCPSCKSYFTAPLRDEFGHLGHAELLSEAPPPPPVPLRAPSSRVQSSLLVPAVLLLLTGVLGTLVNGFNAVSVLADPEGTKRIFVDTQKQIMIAMKQPFDEDAAKDFAVYLPAIYTFVFAVSILPILGGIAMLSCRAWWLAIFGSAVATINLGSCCCLMGAPVGIYCIIKLLDPDVRMLFRREQS